MLNDIFKSLDCNQDGSVTVAEATATLSVQLPPESVERLVSALFGRSKTITYTQFMAKMIGQRRLMRGIFQTFDKDKDGCLDKEELAEMLEKIPALREYLGEGNIDIDGDGVVESWEIRRALKRAFKVARGRPKGC
jgi:Ca2+-binding EF-hand superfamily protein